MKDRTTKACTKCGRILGIDAFRTRWNRKRDKRLATSHCKECLTEESRLWREANPEKSRACSKSHYDRNAVRLRAKSLEYWRTHREERLTYQRSWRRKRNPEIRAKLWRAEYSKHRAAYIIRARLWALKNPERVRENNRANWHKRRAKIIQGDSITAADIQKQLMSQNGKCYWCKQALEVAGKNKFHLDHIFPLMKGGEHTRGNVCCACPSCNLSKNARLPHEFIGRLF